MRFGTYNLPNEFELAQNATKSRGNRAVVANIHGVTTGNRYYEKQPIVITGRFSANSRVAAQSIIDDLTRGLATQSAQAKDLCLAGLDIIANGGFDSWSAGDSAAPDGGYGAANATIAKVTNTDRRDCFGRFSAAFTATATGGYALYADTSGLADQEAMTISMWLRNPGRSNLSCEVYVTDGGYVENLLSEEFTLYPGPQTTLISYPCIASETAGGYHIYIYPDIDAGAGTIHLHRLSFKPSADLSEPLPRVYKLARLVGISEVPVSGTQGHIRDISLTFEVDHPFVCEPAAASTWSGTTALPSNSQNVAIRGTMSAFPTITVTVTSGSSVTYLKVENETTGSYIQIEPSGGIENGDYVFNMAEKTITKGATSYLDDITSESWFWELDPRLGSGVNAVKISGDGTGNTSFAISYDASWLI